MSGFFQVTDAPERRVVQYKRVNAPGVGVVFSFTSQPVRPFIPCATAPSATPLTVP